LANAKTTLVYPKCGSEMKVIAVITDPSEVNKILLCLKKNNAPLFDKERKIITHTININSPVWRCHCFTPEFLRHIINPILLRCCLFTEMFRDVSSSVADLPNAKDYNIYRGGNYET
jgi:hypothetical protein